MSLLEQIIIYEHLNPKIDVEKVEPLLMDTFNYHKQLRDADEGADEKAFLADLVSKKYRDENSKKILYSFIENFHHIEKSVYYNNLLNHASEINKIKWYWSKKRKLRVADKIRNYYENLFKDSLENVKFDSEELAKAKQEYLSKINLKKEQMKGKDEKTKKVLEKQIQSLDSEFSAVKQKSIEKYKETYYFKDYEDFIKNLEKAENDRFNDLMDSIKAEHNIYSPIINPDKMSKADAIEYVDYLGELYNNEIIAIMKQGFPNIISPKNLRKIEKIDKKRKHKEEKYKDKMQIIAHFLKYELNTLI